MLQLVAWSRRIASNGGQDYLWPWRGGLTLSRYEAIYRRSLEDPDGFWREAAADLSWDEQASSVRDANAAFPRWFGDWRGNVCFNAVDRHVEAGYGEQVALVYDSPVRGERVQVTFAALREQVSRAAGMLQQLGVASGDRVLIYMPNSIEAVVAMLACARIGAVHSVVFGGFAAPELATRIRDAQPKVVLAASCGVEVQRVIAYLPIVQEALRIADQPDTPIVVKQRNPEFAVLDADRAYDWDALVAAAPAAAPVPLPGDHPLYILYTSGTTGVPKGVVHDHGGTMVALRWSMAFVYGAQPGDVYWAASDIGWVVGHSYMVYGPLLQRCTTIIYEGKPVGTPDAGAFWRVIQEYGVDVLFTAPTAFRAIKREDPAARLLDAYDTSSLRALFLAGERA
ncbi:MAG: propionyl-CoA synthetase, partial [Candidatus Dadabacteria bacterium]